MNKNKRDMPDVGTPKSLKQHASDYKHRAWTDYTLEELGQWVTLLIKRSSHRSNLEKRAKDLHDARNYLNMLDAQLSWYEDELYEVTWLGCLQGETEEDQVDPEEGVDPAKPDLRVPEEERDEGFV